MQWNENAFFEILEYKSSTFQKRLFFFLSVLLRSLDSVMLGLGFVCCFNSSKIPWLSSQCCYHITLSLKQTSCISWSIHFSIQFSLTGSLNTFVSEFNIIISHFLQQGKKMRLNECSSCLNWTGYHAVRCIWELRGHRRHFTASGIRARSSFWKINLHRRLRHEWRRLWSYSQKDYKLVLCVCVDR